MSNNKEAFKEISNWKLEAKLEDNERYFYLTPEVEQLLKGEKSYVIGRKGTGKTAIASYLKKQKKFNHFAIHLTLKNFPFNQLYELKDGKFTAPNEYITVWKYIIYANLLYLMADNEAVDPKLRSIIKETIPSDPKAALSRKISEWTSGKFSVGFAKFTAALGVSRSNESVEMTWTERAQVLESVILDNIDKSVYFILFDELDEDYKYQSTLGEDGKYLDLITGLFKAVQDVKSIGIDYGKKINPIIFLREDIYDLIRDPDKTKWSDLLIQLRWTAYSIQPLLAYRLSKAINPKQKQISFGKVWNRFFADETIGTGRGRKKQIMVYDWISRSTLLRPRDYIKFIQLCAKKAYGSNYHQILSGLVTTQDILYSSYLRSELIDEVHSIIPDIDNVLEVFAKIGKSQLSVEDFKQAYLSAFEAGQVKSKDYEFVLKMLFSFSIIGNHANDTNKYVFRYINHEANLNLDHAIAIHRGLYKSLQLF